MITERWHVADTSDLNDKSFVITGQDMGRRKGTLQRTQTEPLNPNISGVRTTAGSCKTYEVSLN